jgi:hypothetical protein
MTLTVQPLPPRTFFHSGPKSQRLFQLLTGVLNTNRNLPFANFPFALSGNRFSLYRETCGHGSCANQNPETRWVKESTLLFGRGFPYREIDICEAAVFLHYKSLNPELQYARAPYLCHVTSSLRVIGNRVIAISPVEISCNEISRMPNPDSSGSNATCPYNDQRLRLNREIANRDFDQYETFTGINPSQLLQDLAVSGISRTYPANLGR